MPSSVGRGWKGILAAKVWPLALWRVTARRVQVCHITSSSRWLVWRARDLAILSIVTTATYPQPP